MKNSGQPSAAAANPVPEENSVRPVEASAVIFVAYLSALCRNPLHTATQYALLSAPALGVW